jgi:ABC-type multidrug transport system fused ATPase/permease subunit
MDWGIIAEAIFFLNIALLAIVITIFVFASSLLGRAIAAHAKEQQELSAARRKELEKQLEEAQKHLDTLRKQCETGDFRVDDAIKSLKDAKKHKQEFDKESSALQQSYNVFTVRGGVTYSTCLFFSSMFVSALAWGLATAGQTSFQIGYWKFDTVPFLYGSVPVSLMLIGFGVSRLYSSLQKIREVAITSEEAALKRIVEAFKIAQKELEAEAAPTLELLCTEPYSMPIRIQAGVQTSVEYKIRLTKGRAAENVYVFVYVPPGFDFPGITAKTVSGPRDTLPGYVRTFRKYDSLIEGVSETIRLTIGAPLNTGRFDMFHICTCRNFQGQFGKIEIEVVSKPKSVKKRSVSKSSY